MRSSKAICRLLAVPVLLVACSRDFDVALPPNESQLVVECYLEDGQPLRALVTESTALLDTSLIPPVIMDAVVTITYEGHTDTLQPFLYIDSARNRVYNYGSNTVVQADYGSGAQYRIDVADRRGRHASGTTRFLKPVAIGDMTPEFDPDGEASVITTFPDDPGMKNYYRLVVKRNSLYDSIQQNFLVGDDLATGAGIVARSRSRFLPGDSAHATLYHVTPDYFDFLNTSRNASSALVNPFAASSEVTTNIRGGLGIFTALAFTRKSIRIP